MDRVNLNHRDKLILAVAKTSKKIAFLVVMEKKIVMEESAYKGTRFIGNIPDSAHSPFPVIASEPSVTNLIRYMRPSDIMTISLITTIPPTLYVLWERSKPSVSYRILPKSILFIQIPTFFVAGGLWALKTSLCNC